MLLSKEISDRLRVKIDSRLGLVCFILLIVNFGLHQPRMLHHPSRALQFCFRCTTILQKSDIHFAEFLGRNRDTDTPFKNSNDAITPIARIHWFVKFYATKEKVMLDFPMNFTSPQKPAFDVPIKSFSIRKFNVWYFRVPSAVSLASFVVISSQMNIPFSVLGVLHLLKRNNIIPRTNAVDKSSPDL